MFVAAWPWKMRSDVWKAWWHTAARIDPWEGCGKVAHFAGEKSAPEIPGLVLVVRDEFDPGALWRL